MTRSRACVFLALPTTTLPVPFSASSTSTQPAMSPFNVRVQPFVKPESVAAFEAATVARLEQNVRVPGAVSCAPLLLASLGRRLLPAGPR